MLLRQTILLFFPLLFTLSLARADEMHGCMRQATETKYLVITAASTNFRALECQAKHLAKKSHIPYSRLGRIFNPHRGLIFPDNTKPEIWAGAYLPRRDNTIEIRGKETAFLSIEESDAYPTLKPHLYILIAAIRATPTKAQAVATKLRKCSPTTYIHRTQIDMGCRE
ncbi:MAG: hypothetical protein ACTHN5_02740 [Phycisphaerae bacterium]